MLIFSLWFSSKTQVLNFFSVNHCSLAQQLEFCKAWVSKLGFSKHAFKNSDFQSLGFKNQVFNSQVLTWPDISFSRFPNFWPEKGYFLVYFNRPSFYSHLKNGGFKIWDFSLLILGVLGGVDALIISRFLPILSCGYSELWLHKTRSSYLWMFQFFRWI